LKEATIAQKEAMKDIDIDDLLDLREEMDEMVWESNEINDMLNRDYAVDIDEGELDDELRELDDGMFMDILDKDKNKKQEDQHNYYNDNAQKNVN